MYLQSIAMSKVLFAFTFVLLRPVPISPLQDFIFPFLCLFFHLGDRRISTGVGSICMEHTKFYYRFVYATCIKRQRVDLCGQKLIQGIGRAY